MSAGLDARPIQKMCSASSVSDQDFGGNLTSLIATYSICDDSGATDDWGSREGHLRSHEVTIGFCQKKTRDKMEMRLTNGAKRLGSSRRFGRYLICILTNLGHNLTLTRSEFEIILHGQKIHFSKPSRRYKHGVVIFIFVSLLSKKLLMKNCL